MWFRDLGKFNIALLTKQGWRLTENLESLSAKILCAKYYRGSTFLDSSLGSDPSLI